MNRFKLLAYCKEFPFLHDLIGDCIPDSVRIKRADENLLSFTPHYSSHVGSMGKTKSWEKVHFILQDGTVEDAVLQRKNFSSNYAGDSPYSSDGETVLESIDRHGISQNLAFIVVEQYRLHDWEGSERIKEHAFIIYKPPKDTSFGVEIEKARAFALAEVRAEADF